MIASAPGKLVLAGEYAVLEGHTALVIAVDRRVVARHSSRPLGSSPFLLAVADELGRRFGPDHPSTRAALAITVDSTAMYAGAQKLGLGSSAAVTVAATALALGSVADRDQVFQIASATHLHGQRGAGSGADVAASVHGGALAYSVKQVVPVPWPRGVTLVPFFTGTSADTRQLVAAVAAARSRDQATVAAATHAIATAAVAACNSCLARTPELAATGLLAGLALAAFAADQLAAATGLPLVPPAVHSVRAAVARIGGTAKTTGAGGGDVAICVIPATEDVAIAERSIIEAGCIPLSVKLDQTGVDLHPDVQ